MKQQTELWRHQLIAAGFLEAEKYPNRFFKTDTPLTAFFVNLHVSDDCVSIYYGYASTAFTRIKGDENCLTERGIPETGSCLRFHVCIHCVQDAENAGEKLKEIFHQYRGTEKDALLAMIKEKRKRFLDQITHMLKPLGFRRKGSEWSRDLSADHTVCFLADKSPYSDTYNFPIAISAHNKNFRNRYYCTIATLQPADSRVFDCEAYSSHRFDWQLHTHEDLSELVHRFLRMYVSPAEKGMETLGKEEYIRKGCFCPRDCCDHCWVGKNHTETAER